MSATGDTLEHLSTWLRTESPTHAPAGVNRMMDLVAAEVADAPVAVERIAGPGRARRRAGRCGPGRRRASPPSSSCRISTPCTRSAPPTTICRCGSRATGSTGPALYDMKGGAYLALAGLQGRSPARGGARRPLVFLFTPDEEIGSPTTRRDDRGPRPQAPPSRSSPSRPATAARSSPAARASAASRCRSRAGRPIPARATQDGRSAIREAARQILAHRGHDRLRARRDDDGRHDLRRHGARTSSRSIAASPSTCASSTSPTASATAAAILGLNAARSRRARDRRPAA